MTRVTGWTHEMTGRRLDDRNFALPASTIIFNILRERKIKSSAKERNREDVLSGVTSAGTNNDRGYVAHKAKSVFMCNWNLDLVREKRKLRHQITDLGQVSEILRTGSKCLQESCFHHHRDLFLKNE